MSDFVQLLQSPKVLDLVYPEQQLPLLRQDSVASDGFLSLKNGKKEKKGGKGSSLGGGAQKEKNRLYGLDVVCCSIKVSCEKGSVEQVGNRKRE